VFFCIYCIKSGIERSSLITQKIKFNVNTSRTSKSIILTPRDSPIVLESSQFLKWPRFLFYHERYNGFIPQTEIELHTSRTFRAKTGYLHRLECVVIESFLVVKGTSRGTIILTDGSTWGDLRGGEQAAW